MSDTRGGERPRQATVAAWLIMLGSVFVVVSVFEQIGGIHTLEAREAAERVVSEPPGNGLGVDADTVLSLMRVLSMIAGACATATAILGYQVLQRVRSARLALSILAVPLFLSGMVVGGFLSAVVVAASVMLWLQPSRDWLDGVTRQAPRPDVGAPPSAGDPFVTPPTSGQEPHGGHGSDPALPSSPPPSAAEPRAYPGFGTQAGQTGQTGQTDQAGQPGAGPATYPAQPGAAGWPVPGVGTGGTEPRRPAAVVWACLITWILGGLVVLVLLISGIAVVAAPDLLLDEMYRQNPQLADEGITRQAIIAGSLVVVVLAVVWAVAAQVVAFFVWRRAGWARVVLAFSAGGAAGVFLILTASTLLLVVPLVGAAATVFLLLRPEVRAWFAARGARQP